MPDEHNERQSQRATESRSALKTSWRYTKLTADWVLRALGAITLVIGIWQLFPTVSIEFPDSYFDGRPHSTPFIIKNTSSLFSIQNVMTVLHYKYLRVGTASWSNSYTYIDPIQEIKPNHESTVEFSEGFHIGLSSPIKSVDGLVTVTVTYQIWFLHVNNSETYDFYPVKESDYSVHWRQK